MLQNTEIEEVYKSNKYIQVKKEIKNITAREFATAIALRKAIKKLKITNAISFHRSILRAENFRQQQELITKVYPDYQPIKTFHVSGAMPTNQRASQMRLFAESKGLMTNARCLTEGVDLPAIDCVCFTDPKRSKVDIVQAAGRALRLSKGKKFGYILIPIFVSKNQDPNEAAEDSGFEEVIATVGALSTQDTRIADYLRGVAEGNIPRGGNPVDGITKINVLTKVDMVNRDQLKKARAKFGREKPIEIAAPTGKGVVKLKRLIYNTLDFMSVFMKPQGEKADMEEPLVVRKGTTIAEICQRLHRDFRRKFRYSQVWGPSAKFPGQTVGLNHKVKDSDVVSIIMHR